MPQIPQMSNAHGHFIAHYSYQISGPSMDVNNPNSSANDQGSSSINAITTQNSSSVPNTPTWILNTSASHHITSDLAA